MHTKDRIKAGRMRLGMTHQAFGDAVGVFPWWEIFLLVLLVFLLYASFSIYNSFQRSESPQRREKKA